MLIAAATKAPDDPSHAANPGVYGSKLMRDSEDFFHRRIDQMVDLRHPLAVLASHMPWQEIEASLAQQLAREVKKGRSIQEHGLFGSQTAIVGGGVSKAGRPRLPFRLMVSLLYLKHAFNESDEGLVERWSANTLPELVSILMPSIMRLALS